MSSAPRSASATTNRYLLTIVSGVVVVGVLLSAWTYQYSREIENSRTEAEFGRRAATRYAMASQVVAYYESGLYALKSLFEGSDEVSRDEFRELAVDILARHPGIKALEWVPVVRAGDRAAVEAQASRETGRPFTFTERQPSGTMGPAQNRPEYYPILYLEPMAGNEAAYGLDTQTAPNRPHLERARATRLFVVSHPFQLVQGDRGVVMVWPVFSRAPGELTERICRGFVQGVFRVDQVLTDKQLQSPATSLDEYYADTTAGWSGAQFLHAHRGDAAENAASPPTEAEIRAGLHREYTIELGGRRWTALYRPTASWLAEQRAYKPVIWLGVGVVMTGLLSGLIVSMGRRTVAIQRQVEARTSELNESRHQLSNLLHALPGVAFRSTFHDLLDEPMFVSEGSLPLTGYTAQEFTSGGVSFGKLIAPEHVARVRDALRTALNNRQDFELEYPLRTRDGSEKWVLSRGRGIYAEDGALLFYDGLIIDITARKQAESDKMAMERRLLESQKLESLGLLAGGIAHDFNNILTGIMGHASLARFSPGTETDITEHLLKIEASAARAAELCQQMLAFSGRARFVIEPVDLNKVVRDTLPLLQGSIPSRARLQLNFSPEPVIVMGDATQLRQIAMNLILNAGESLPAMGGLVQVSTRVGLLDGAVLSGARVGQDLAPGRYAIMEVRDTGSGMSPETLARIFDPFFTTKFTGRGLGLAAVLGIVRGHSGALHVESEPGKGSVFTLMLPSTAQSLSPALGNGTANPWRRTGHVLVIDDEEPVREIAGRLLRTFGFTVSTADGGAEALRQYREAPSGFDLVVLDLTMPGMDGIDTLTELRAFAPKVPVILVSGYSEGERAAELADKGPLLFLQKPFSRNKLEQHLRKLLENDSTLADASR